MTSESDIWDSGLGRISQSPAAKQSKLFQSMNAKLEGFDNPNFVLSQELEETSQELANAKKHAQDKNDEYARLASLTKSAEFQNQEMGNLISQANALDMKFDKQTKIYKATTDPARDNYLGTNVTFPNSGAGESDGGAALAAAGISSLGESQPITGYVTNMGVFKWFQTPSDQKASEGKNGCPAASATTVLPQGSSINTGRRGSYSQGTTPVIFSGTPMVPGQSCGNEGKNVMVTSVMKNPNSTLLGLYNDSTSNPAMMTYLDGGAPNYNYSSCLQAAVDNGSSFFSLGGADPGAAIANPSSAASNSTCGLSNDSVQIASNGQAISKCNAQSDNYVYGNSGSMALYTNNPAQYVGLYNDNPQTRAMIPVNNMSSTFSYGSCQAYAVQNGYKYFAIQNANPSSIDVPNAQCFVTNDLSSAQQYGQIDNRKGIPAKDYWTKTQMTLGGNLQNAVYSLSGQPTPSGCFMTPKAGLMAVEKGSTYAQCAQQADTYLMPFFGLGNYDPSTGTGSCYISPFQQVLASGGPSVVSVEGSDGNSVGVGQVNAIYQLTDQGDPSALGQVGYVDANAELKVYPADMLTSAPPGQGTYSSVANTTVNGFDMTSATTGTGSSGAPVTMPIPNQTVESCQNLCEEQGEGTCGGFVLDNSLNCYLKTPNFMQAAAATMTPGSEAAGTSSVIPTMGATTYIRNPALSNDRSCSQDMVGIDSVTWANYPMPDGKGYGSSLGWGDASLNLDGGMSLGSSGGGTPSYMTQTTKCGLAAFTAGTEEAKSVTENELDGVAHSISKTGSELYHYMHGKEGFDTGGMGIFEITQMNSDLIQKGSDQYFHVKNLSENESPSLAGMLSVSDTAVLQRNTEYTVWMIIALVVLCLAIVGVYYVLNAGEPVAAAQ